MSSALDKYEQLIAQELAGIISAEDLEELNKAKAEKPEVYELWEEHQRLFSKTGVQQWMEEKTNLPPASDIPAPQQYKQISIVATCIAIFIMGGLFFLFPAKKPVQKLSADVIQLRLENGTVIDLSQPGETEADNILFRKKPDSLSYSSHSATSPSAELIVPAGKKYTITLPDSTAVTLNAASSLRFSATLGSTREVSITGEAYFKVTKKAGRPFVVKTALGEVVVFGTAFNINSYDKKQLKVSLVEGKVQYKNGRDSCLLTPGHCATGTTNAIQVSVFNPDIELGWLKGNHRFNNKTIEELLQVLMRLYGQEIILDNAHISKVTITGMFIVNKPISFNLNHLQKIIPFDYYTDEKNIIHIR